MKRILVIGCPGSGKSTLSRRLRDILHLPLIYLDQIWHLPDGSHISPEEFDEQLAEVLDSPCWILDGNYRRTLKTRLEHCDTVILLDFPTEVCLKQAAERIGHQREDLPWIETEFDPEFQDWIRHFRERNLPGILAMLKEYRESRSIYVLHSHQETEDFIQTLKQLQHFGLKR
ncbi:adenylate kinase [Faecalibaculum rodentium]|uniref:Adenylate kinase n=1 Tax=Faecalibaculum rodentium TaxID=1702221 RepID=A0A1Q9YKY4_9FIRM|nr:adenylate kinase [Faecalibaculum rodentium]OLU45463.1 adenylate kinase [Faecalibaculum rodentium]